MVAYPLATKYTHLFLHVKERVCISLLFTVDQADLQNRFLAVSGFAPSFSELVSTSWLHPLLLSTGFLKRYRRWGRHFCSW